MNAPRLILLLVLLAPWSAASAGRESPGFKVGCLVLGTPPDLYHAAGRLLLGELTVRTQVDPEPDAWKKMDESLQGAPPFLWIILGSAAKPDAALAKKLQRFMASGGTVFAEADGSIQGRAALDQLRAGVLGERGAEPLKGGELLTRTFYILPAMAASQVRVLVTARRLAWIESPRSLLLSIAGGSVDDGNREYALRMAVNIVLYTLTGSYKDDLTHMRYLMRRRKP